MGSSVLTGNSQVSRLRLGDVRYHPEAVLYEVPGATAARIRELAEARQKPKDGDLRARDKRISNIGNVDAHVNGLMGEWAASQWLGVPVDTRPMLAGDPRGDFVWRTLTIEVKTRRGMLAIQGLFEFVANVLILATIDKFRPGKVWLQGWTTAEEFKKRFFWNDFGYGKQMTMQPRDLYAMRRLHGYADYLRLPSVTGEPFGATNATSGPFEKLGIDQMSQ